MSDRKEITKFLGNLLENQYFSGIGKYWAKEVSVDFGSTEKAIHRTIRHFYTVLNVTLRSPKKVIHRTKSHSNPYQKSHLTVPKVTFRARKRPKNAAPRGLLNIYKYIKYQLLLYL